MSQRDNNFHCISPNKIRHSSTLQVKQPQISEQFQAYESTFQHYDQQKTARITPQQYQQQRHFTQIKNKAQDLDLVADQQNHLLQLTYQINTQRETIMRISHIIDFLTEKNQELNLKYAEAVHELEAVHNFYQEKLEAANTAIRELEQKCNRYQINFNQNRNPNARVTPIKICSKNSGENCHISFNQSQNSALEELRKIILSERIHDVQHSLSQLQEFAIGESTHIATAIDQHKYIQAFIEDEILGFQDNDQINRQPWKNSNTKQSSSIGISELISKYKSQLIAWQNYSNLLKKYLTDCICFIQNFINTKDIRSEQKKRAYSNQDLIKYITQQICKIFGNKMKKNKDEMNEMRELLKDAFKQLEKKYEQKDSIQVEQF